jgi:hypothetical protein
MGSQTKEDSCGWNRKPDMHVRLKTDNSLPFNKTYLQNRTCMSGVTDKYALHATALNNFRHNGTGGLDARHQPGAN